jgi:hypothetical protein
LSSRLRNPDLLGWALLAAAIAVAAGLVFWLQRGLTFGWDEYVWIEIGGVASVDQFTHPYGGHLIVVPYYLFRAILELFGMSFTAFAVVQVTLTSLMAVLLYVYARRRLGPILALAPAVLMLFLGGSYPVLLEPLIGIQFLAALVPGFAAIVLLEREDLGGDVAACALLCLALAGFSSALPFLLGAVVAVALSPGWKRRIWVVAIPILAYGYWRIWASQFESTGVIESNVPFLPPYFVDAIAVYATSAFGMGNLVGPGPFSLFKLGTHEVDFLFEGAVYLVLELLVIGIAFVLLRRRGPVPRSLWVAAAMLVGLFVELGVILAPGRTAAEPRYLYPGVLLLLLVAIELARGVRTTRVSVAVAGLLLLAAVTGNIARFQDGRALLVDYSQRSKADMAVIELAGKDGDQAFTPNQQLAKVVPGSLVLNSGPWLLAVERYGSVAYSVPELQAAAPAVRAEADLVARRSLRLKLVPAAPAATDRCRRLGSAAAAAGFELPRGGALLAPAAAAESRLRRWGGEFGIELGSIPAAGAELVIPPDAAAGVPWRAQLRPGTEVAVCPIE